MADNLNLIKISELIPTTELKSSDIIPISQDGETRSIKGAVLEQKLLDKTDGRYIKNSEKGANNGVATLDAQGEVIQPVRGVVKESDIGIKVPGLVDGKVPNSQLKFGAVEDGNPNMVSGGDIFTNVYKPLTDIQKLNNVTINIGKSYPMVNLPTSEATKARVSLLNNILLDAELIKYEKDINYFIGAFYKGNTQQGNGFVISRNLRGTGGGTFITTKGVNAASVENKEELERKFDLGGIQKFDLKIAAWNLEFSLTIDIDAINSTYVQIAYQDYPNWLTSDFSTNVYKPFDFNFSNDKIPSFKTYKEALKVKQKGVFRVGNTLAKNKVENIAYNGDNENFKPSDVTNQYGQLYGGIKNNIEVKGKLITIRKWDGTGNANVTWVSKYNMYFTENIRNSFVIASNDVKTNTVTKDTNDYKLVKIPDQLTNAEFPNQIRKVIELPDGELLIETRAGKESTPDTYQSREVLVYKTIGFKNKEFTNNELTLLDSELKYVTKYPSNTETRQGWSWSIYQNNILIAPYGANRTGVILYSNDYGESFTCIFNMGVSGFPVALNNNSDEAYPLPGKVIPAQPADMWTRGTGNAHVHGALYDQYFDRIWIFSGDNQDPEGRSDTWYTDDFGKTYHKLLMRTPGRVDSVNGFQALNGIAHPDYVLLGSDSFTNGFVRYSRGMKNEIPEFEAVYWRNDTYVQTLDCLCGGIDLDDNGQVVSIFHPNLDYTKKGFVVRSSDGLKFDKIYDDEYSDGTQSGTKFGWSVDIRKSINGSYLIVVPPGNGSGLILL